MAIELKKQVRKKDHMQAILQLIAANCHSNYPVMTLLTDLGQTWHCYWTNTDGIQECWFELPYGIAFIESYLRGESEQLGACIMQDYFKARIGHGEQASLLEVRVDGLVCVCVGGGVSEQRKRRKVGICKVDIMDLLPEPCVEDMRDFLMKCHPKRLLEDTVCS